jgi:hypothetical protein
VSAFNQFSLVHTPALLNPMLFHVRFVFAEFGYRYAYRFCRSLDHGQFDLRTSNYRDWRRGDGLAWRISLEHADDPQQPIPPFIQHLTGITCEMVRGAPTFDEIARELFERLDGKLFVAHNASFDRSFLHSAFRCADYVSIPMFCAPFVCHGRCIRRKNVMASTRLSSVTPLCRPPDTAR